MPVDKFFNSRRNQEPGPRTEVFFVFVQVNPDARQIEIAKVQVRIWQPLQPMDDVFCLLLWVTAYKEGR